METFNVELPDGRILEGVPVGTTKAQIAAKLGASAPPLGGTGNPEGTGAEVRAVLDKTLRGGALALPGMIGDAAVGGADWLTRKLTGYEGESKLGQPGETMWPSDALAQITGGPIGKPETRVGKLAGNIGEAVTGAVAGAPGVSSLKGFAKAAPSAAGIGLGAGVGGESTAAVLGDSPATRLVGGLVGGGLTGAMQNYKSNNVDKVARTMFEGVSRREVEEALRTQASGAREGLDLNLGQSLNRPTNVDAVLASLANSSEGKNATALLRSQPGQIKIGTEMAVQGLPGQVRATRDIANRSQEAADDLIRQGQKQATAEWQRLAPQGAMVPESAVGQFDNRLAALARKYPNTARAEMIQDVRAALRSGEQPAATSPLLGANGLPITPASTAPKYLTDALQLKGAIDDVLQNFGSRKLNTPGTTGKELQTAQEIREMFSKSGGVLETYAPQLIAANRAYENVMTGVVNPLKKSAVGELAGRSGAVIDVNAPQGKLMRIFDAGTDPTATRSEILTTARALNKSDPELFVDAAKTWISGKLQKALNSPEFRDSDNLASQVTRAFGAPSKASNQTKGLEDVLAGMAESQGVPASSLQALPKFLAYVSRAAERPSSTAGVTASDIGAMEAASAVGRIGHVSKITMLRQPILAYTNRLQSNTRAEVDRLLSSPEGVRMLHDLSRTSPWTAAGQKAISTFIAGNAEAQGDGR